MASISEPLHIEDPALQKGSLILVTGVNGYIGSHIARQLLASGYNVRGVVRKLEKASFLFDLFAPYGKESFSLVEVADFTVEGIWDKVVKGKTRALNRCHTQNSTNASSEQILQVWCMLRARLT